MKTFDQFIEESVGKFEKDYHTSLKPAQKKSIETALSPEIKMYMSQGYDVTLRTTRDADLGTEVTLFIKKGKQLSSLVARKSMGPNGKLKDIM